MTYMALKSLVLASFTVLFLVALTVSVESLRDRDWQLAGLGLVTLFVVISFAVAVVRVVG